MGIECSFFLSHRRHIPEKIIQTDFFIMLGTFFYGSDYNKEAALAQYNNKTTVSKCLNAPKFEQKLLERGRESDL